MGSSGDGVEQNMAKAIELFTQAHAKGVAIATQNLGSMFLHGEGVEQNKAKAIELFREAHAKGNAEATCSLGVLYNTGNAVQQDEAKAFELFQQAHAMGSPRRRTTWAHSTPWAEPFSKTKPRRSSCISKRTRRAVSKRR